MQSHRKPLKNLLWCRLWNAPVIWVAHAPAVLTACLLPLAHIGSILFAGILLSYLSRATQACAADPQLH